jgi:uncharacterized Zn-binding protein involved in type VI secretion
VSRNLIRKDYNSPVPAKGKLKMKQLDATDDSMANAMGAPASVPRKIVARYSLATIGSRTSRGGEVVIEGQGQYVDPYRIACVGDRVRYPDGSESVITSGAGAASTFADKPVALVGSHIANGDHIVSSLQSIGEIILYEGDPPIPGLLQPSYVTPITAMAGDRCER